MANFPALITQFILGWTLFLWLVCILSTPVTVLISLLLFGFLKFLAFLCCLEECFFHVTLLTSILASSTEITCSLSLVTSNIQPMLMAVSRVRFLLFFQAMLSYSFIQRWRFELTYLSRSYLALRLGVWGQWRRNQTFPLAVGIFYRIWLPPLLGSFWLRGVPWIFRRLVQVCPFHWCHVCFPPIQLEQCPTGKWGKSLGPCFFFLRPP